MSHFEFDFEDDMSYPVLLFLIKWGFHIREMTETKLESRATKIFPIEVYFKPYN